MRSLGGNTSAPMSSNFRLGKRSCQAGPLATSESQRSERQRSAMRLRSSTMWSMPIAPRCSLIAMPAWPAPITKVLVFSTDIAFPKKVQDRIRASMRRSVSQMAALDNLVFWTLGLGKSKSLPQSQRRDLVSFFPMDRINIHKRPVDPASLILQSIAQQIEPPCRTAPCPQNRPAR
ncbi:hypothetical protein D3C78_1160250 [compost metagenome]